MARILKISTLLFALFVLCAPSCEDEQEIAIREASLLNASKNEIREEFEKEYLTEASLYAYETAAKQKLSDLADYFNILADTSLDFSFRSTAAEMIKSTFQSENISLQFSVDIEKPREEIEVHQLISDGLENKLVLTTFTFDSIQTYEPIHRIGNSTYSGILSFKQNFNSKTSADQIRTSLNRKADISLKKETKIFGNDTLSVWEVRLGVVK